MKDPCVNCGAEAGGQELCDYCMILAQEETCLDHDDGESE